MEVLVDDFVKVAGREVVEVEVLSEMERVVHSDSLSVGEDICGSRLADR